MPLRNPLVNRTKDDYKEGSIRLNSLSKSSQFKTSPLLIFPFQTHGYHHHHFTSTLF
ncbi:hypothetical protein HanPSC8_Chr13g0551541 [Helianthus annuus]|nr:hypothetical protein HanPSC8_Chr13g0551541 [Helianthus annuus]